jgi:hypothetical protein
MVFIMVCVTDYGENVVVSEYSERAFIHQADLEQEIAERIKIKNGEPHLLMIKLHGVAIFGEDAKSIIASDEVSKITKAVAIVCGKESGYFEHGVMLLENFFWENKLSFPTKIFDCEADALAWLKSKEK